MNERRLLLILNVFIATLMLTACSQQRLPENVYPWPIWHLPKPVNWRAEGRLSIVSGKESLSASLDWRHDANKDVIELSGPFGQGRFLLTITPITVSIFDGENDFVTTESAEKVIKQYYNITLPVSALRFWILGGVEPGVEFSEGAQGFLQRGWDIKYRQLEKVDETILPNKIQLQQTGIKVKVVVDQWTLT